MKQIQQTQQPTNKGRRKRVDRRTKGIFIRLTEAEQNQLKELSLQSGISISQLLRVGALEGLHRLPRFRRLPTDVNASLARLDRLTAAMVYLSGRFEQDLVLADDIRQMVYGVGDVIRQVRQCCSDNMTSYALLNQFDELIEQLQQPNDGAGFTLEILSRLQSLRTSFQTDPVR